MHLRPEKSSVWNCKTLATFHRDIRNHAVVHDTEELSSETLPVRACCKLTCHHSCCNPDAQWLRLITLAIRGGCEWHCLPATTKAVIHLCPLTRRDNSRARMKRSLVLRPSLLLASPSQSILLHPACLLFFFSLAFKHSLHRTAPLLRLLPESQRPPLLYLRPASPRYQV